jgi:hypothetical protein
MIYIPFIKKTMWICVFTKNNKVYSPFLVYVVSRYVSWSRFRPLVLFHETPGEREKEIDVPRGTLARKAAEFERLCLYLLVSKGWFRDDWQVAVFDLVRKKSKIEEVFGLSCML